MGSILSLVGGLVFGGFIGIILDEWSRSDSSGRTYHYSDEQYHYDTDYDPMYDNQLDDL